MLQFLSSCMDNYDSGKGSVASRVLGFVLHAIILVGFGAVCLFFACVFG